MWSTLGVISVKPVFLVCAYLTGWKEESWELPFLQCERQVLCVYLNSLSVRQQFIVCHNTFQRSCPSTWLVCTSIWSHLSSISKTCSIHVQWIPAHVGIPGNTLAELEAKRDSTHPQTSVSVDLATARFWFGGQVRRSSMPATYATRTQPHIALWLERPICSLTGDLAGPEASASLLPSWHNNSLWCITLWRRWWDDAASSTLLPVAHTGTYIHQLHQLYWSSMHVVLYGVYCGRDTLPNQEWEREYYV